jgi:hypothetical protein
MLDGKIKMSMHLEPLKKFQRKSPAMFGKAMEVGGIQFLTWANKGSKDEPRTPPIRWGVLRGSASAFLGSKLLTIFSIPIKAGAPERPTPAKSHSATGLVITWVWNVRYAWKMHEWLGGWGKFTRQAENAGSKWLEKHLIKDRDALIDVIGRDFKKRTGM